MAFHPVSPSNPLPSSILYQLALGSPLDEISNHPGSVRHHIFHHGDRDPTTNRLRWPMLFFVYQTGRQGPQNGFRLCLVKRGFHIRSPDKHKEEKEEEDDIDRVEKCIDQGWMEVVILGDTPVYESKAGCDDGADVNVVFENAVDNDGCCASEEDVSVEDGRDDDDDDDDDGK